MKEPIDRLPPYVSDLLAVEREAPPPPRDAHDRVRARIVATVVAGGTTGAAATAIAAKGASTGILASLMAAKTTVIAVMAVAATGVTGSVALHRRHARMLEVTTKAEPLTPRAPDRQGASPIELPPPAAPIPSAAAEVVGSTVIDSPPAPRRRSPSASSPSRIDQRTAESPSELAQALADENVLLEAARSALRSRDAARASALLARHARLHPAGQMEEEREALWVQALVAEGDGAAARARAAAFRERFPRSIQREVVSAALETIP